MNVTEDVLRPDNRILAFLFNPAVRFQLLSRAWCFFQCSKTAVAMSRSASTLDFFQAALWRNGINGRRHYTGPRTGRDAAARAAASHLGFVVSNRALSGEPFSFYIALEGVPSTGPAPTFEGHGYMPNVTDLSLGTVAATMDSYGHWALTIAVPPLSVQVILMI